MNDTNHITACIVPDADRMAFVDALFGLHFPLRLEPTVFNVASRLAPDYRGGLWVFYALSNGGFFMAPEGQPLRVSSDNGFTGTLSSEAFGITACLYAYSLLSFGEGGIAETYSEHYHWLRDYVLDHPEVAGICAACD